MEPSSQKVLDAGGVRVGSVGAIPALLRLHANEPPEQILAEVGLDLGLFEDPDNSVSFVNVGRLLDLCAKRTGIPHFGLLVGQQAAPGSIGRLVELAAYAPNVGSALNSMILHICMNDRGGVATLSSEHGIAKLGYAVYLPLHEGIIQVYSAALAILCNLMRSLCGETWAPSKVCFSHSPPRDTKPYESFFRAPVLYETDEDTLLFKDSWLRKRIPSADAGQYKVTVEQLTAIESRMGIDFLEEMRSILRPLIVTHRCSLEQAAHMLALHPRTLNRRLEKHGTTFRKIVGEMRQNIARQLLVDSSMPLIRISTLLGYADASVFSRAFKRWSGIPPREWRRRHDGSFSAERGIDRLKFKE